MALLWKAKLCGGVRGKENGGGVDNENKTKQVKAIISRVFCIVFIYYFLLVESTLAWYLRKRYCVCCRKEWLHQITHNFNVYFRLNNYLHFFFLFFIFLFSWVIFLYSIIKSVKCFPFIFLFFFHFSFPFHRISILFLILSFPIFLFHFIEFQFFF